MSDSYFREWMEEQAQARRLLLVDDNKDDCDLIVRQSRDFAIEWSVTHTYAEALECLDQKKFRLVVLDLNLGGGPGGENLFFTIKEKWPWLPVLVLAGQINSDEINRMTKRGFVMFVIKPPEYNWRFFGELFFAFNIPRREGAGTQTQREEEKEKK